jgi:mannitol/fructose-specific phosphotransferase system IIA component (Ntr-type)
MSFVALLRPELIRVSPSWRSFGDTVAGLVATLVEAGELPAAAASDAVRAVAAREAEASTALLDIGAGVPHARLAGLAQAVGALVASRHGLYEPVPTVQIRIVALVLSPPHAVADHLNVLASVATLLRSPELRTALVNASDPDAALAALRRHARSVP